MHAVLALCMTPPHLASSPLGFALPHGGMRSVVLTHSPSCMPLGMRRSIFAPDHAPYFAVSSRSTTPPYVRQLTLPTYGPLPSGAWVPEPLPFPLSGMGLALRLPQRAAQTCFCGLSSPHLHRVTHLPNQVCKHVPLNMLTYPMWKISAQPPKPSATPPSQRRRSGRPWPLCLPHQPLGPLGSLGQWSNTFLSPSPRDLPHSSMPA